MLITKSYPAINLAERGVQIDLRSVDEGGLTCDHHLAQVAPPRSKGVHVSSLIRAIAINTGKLKGKHGSQYNMNDVIDEKDFPLPMMIGMAIEDWLSRQYPSMLYHIGELELDEIFMSPDGVTIDHDMDPALGTGIIEEFKASYKSSRKPIEEQWMWLCQVKAYCKALPTLVSRLHVIYLNGDYDFARKGMPPQYIIYSIQWTQEELDANWQMIVNELADWKRRGLA